MLTVAVVDDSPADAAVTRLGLEDAEYHPVMVRGPLPNIDDAVAQISSLAEAAVCDHRLRTKGWAGFDGADLVARLYKARFAAVLVTQYIHVDSDGPIRSLRRFLPAVLSRDSAGPDALRDAIECSRREVAGQFADLRRPFRALVHVVGVHPNEGYFEAFVRQWNPREAVRIPLQMLPESLRASVRDGARLISTVNIGASTSDQLYFDGFTVAPDLDPNDGLA